MFALLRFWRWEACSHASAETVQLSVQVEEQENIMETVDRADTLTVTGTTLVNNTINYWEEL